MSIFWRILIKIILDRGNEVVCIAPGGDSESEAFLQRLGARVVNCNVDRKGLNPFKDLIYLRELKKIFLAENPDVIFATTIKPVIYGCMAGHSAKVPYIFATITGLGYVFEANNRAKRMLMKIGIKMYRHSLALAKGVFFQNRDDSKLFLKQNIINNSQNIFFANGTGVDTRHFNPAALPNLQTGITFLLIGRLLEAKGIAEYIDAAQLLKSNPAFKTAKFQLLGIPEQGPGSYPLEKVMEWHNKGIIEYLGQTRDVRPYLAACHVAVLPSWREGVPTSIMEAMSVGRPCVTTDAPGCREVVKPGINGWLCIPKNSQSLAQAMKKFLDDPNSIPPMGAASRKLAVTQFEASKVAEKILADMDSVIEAKQVKKI